LADGEGWNAANDFKRISWLTSKSCSAEFGRILDAVANRPQQGVRKKYGENFINAFARQKRLNGRSASDANHLSPNHNRRVERCTRHISRQLKMAAGFFPRTSASRHPGASMTLYALLHYAST